MMGMMGANSGNMMNRQAELGQNPTTCMMGMGSNMNQMMESMEDKSGDEFDKAFIEAMIPHHQGAIEMAKEAQLSASHPEIKNLADEIIAAQTNEINMMRQWQSEWSL